MGRWARNLVLDWLSCKTEGRKAAPCHMWTCVVMPALGSGCHFEPLRRLLSYTRGTRIMAWKVSRFMVFAREQTIKDQSFFSSSFFLGRLRRPFVEVQTPLALWGRRQDGQRNTISLSNLCQVYETVCVHTIRLLHSSEFLAEHHRHHVVIYIYVRGHFRSSVFIFPSPGSEIDIKLKWNESCVCPVQCHTKDLEREKGKNAAFFRYPCNLLLFFFLLLRVVWPGRAWP